jgi:hypothetical protein
MNIEMLEAEVLSLPPAARSHMLDRIIASFETDSAWEQAWLLEAKRRDADVESGKSELLDGNEVIQALRARLA